MRICSIASGSSGNCIYAGSESTHLLFDTGISGKRIAAGLNDLGLTTGDIQGILVSHEHIDHISGLGVVARKYGIPIYASQGTIDAIKACSSVGKIDSSLFHVIEADRCFSIGDIEINPIKTSHDAAEPLAFSMQNGKSRAAVVTDIGTYDSYIIDRLKNMDVLFLEANHDINMLQVGVYPYYLKQRILGEKGHLANEYAGRLLGQVLHDDFKVAVLGHLSKENNYEELAYETVKLEVDTGDNPYTGEDFPIEVAKRDCLSEVINF